MATRDFDLRVEATLAPADQQYLEDRLYEFNAAATGIGDGDTLAICARDAAGRLVAAATGCTWGGCCEVRQLWVRDDLRRRGWGRRIMTEVETEARRRGCAFITLSTHSFQAPDFYAALGYREVAAIADYPRGHRNVHMRKDLRVESP
jgi:GNAT superfamily N-acetyltransferase